MNLIYPIKLEAMLVVLALGTLVLEAVRPTAHPRRLGLVLAAAVLALFAYSFVLPATNELYLNGTYKLDAFALFFKRLILLITALVLITAREFAARLEHNVAENYVLILLASVGMLVLSSAVDFILLFVALELITITFYILTSFQRGRLASLEAGTKYLIIGALSTGLLVYGISYIFGTTGTTNFAAVAASIDAQSGPSTTLALGILFVLLGLAFKIAAVPAQMWAPDVYQGAPLPATAFLATGSKTAGFAVLLRLLFEGLLPARATWGPVIFFIAGLSLLYGNLGAVPQRDVKRMLGYSSIAHAGYLLLGVVAMSALGISAILFYLAQYTVASMAGFLAMACVANAGGGSDVGSFSGLHRRSPLLAAGLTLSMLSLAGIPPLSGFFGKFLLFSALLASWQTSPLLVALAIVAAFGVVVSLVFYFGVAKAVYAEDAPGAAPIAVSFPTRVGIIACLAATIFLGVYQEPLLKAAAEAASSFGLK